MTWKYFFAAALGFLAGGIADVIWPAFMFRLALATFVVLFFYVIEPIVGWIGDGAPIRLPWR